MGARLLPHRDFDRFLSRPRPPTDRRRRSRQIVLIERLANQPLDHRLPADVQILGPLVQFFEHGSCEIHVDSLNWGHHPASIRKELRNIATLLGETRDGFRRYRYPLPTSVLHKAVSITVMSSKGRAFRRAARLSALRLALATEGPLFQTYRIVSSETKPNAKMCGRRG